MAGRIKVSVRASRALSIAALLGAAAASSGIGCSSDGGNGDRMGAVSGVCGNGVIEGQEQCDGPVTTTSCAMATMGMLPAGNVTCSGCRIVTTDCHAAAAGSGGAPGVAGASSNGNGGAMAAATGGGPASNGGASAGGTSSGSGGTSSGGAAGGGAPGGGAGGGSQGGSSGGGGAGPTDPVLGDLNALRQACVDEINMYRATISGLTPLTRASASVETCSDQGAASDGAAGVAHGSAGKCPGMSAQDTCPGWPVTGGAIPALKKCLQQMWAEGEPPEGRQKCLSDYFAGNTQCFLSHGHYLNMSDSSNHVVSCGFAALPGNKAWMNQDFGR